MRRLRFTSLLISCIASISFPISAFAYGTVDFCGKVACDGKGIAGVPVTDGVHIVVTDAKGNYKLTSFDDAKYVYITLPDGYKIPYENGSRVPTLFKKVPEKLSKKEIIDFNLEKANDDRTKSVLVIMADPQVYFRDEIPELQLGTKDIKELMTTKYPGQPTVGICVGDIIGDITTKPSLFEPVTDAINESGVPFFFAVGNHDITWGSPYSSDSKKVFNYHYGPNYYSFNFGGIHYVVLDNVLMMGSRYVGYLPEQQLKWLEQDLALVPHGSEVVLAFHIPAYSPAARVKNWGKEQSHRILNNRQALFKMLKPYNAHLMTGHEHYNENYVLADNLYEHNHAPMSNLFWMAPWSWDGSPSGYAVYEVENGKIINWYYKSVGYAPEYQMEVYPVGRSRQHPEAVVANVFNRDTTWKVVWYENGELRGDMTPFRGHDPNIWDYVVAHEKNFKHPGIGCDWTEHLYYAVPQVKGSTVRVEATDYNGNVYVQEIKNSN